MMKKNVLIISLIALSLFAVLLASMGIAPSAAAPMPAPLAAPTPIGVSPSGAVPKVVDLFTARSLTSDVTSPCVEVSGYEKADIYYSITIDSGNVNTSTVYLQFGNSPSALVTGVAVASAVVANATAMQQYDLFGSYLCLRVDSTDASTGTVTITANALVK